MEVREYIRVLKRQWAVVVIAALLGLLCAGAASVFVSPVYTSETQLFVAMQSSGSVQDLAQGSAFSQARVQSYVKTITTPAVLQPVIDELGLQVSPETLAKHVKASADVDTVLITISVSDNSAVQAAAIGRGVASSLVTAVDSLEKPKSGGSSPVRLSVVTPATVPTRPSSPNVTLDLLIGVLSGLSLGIGGAVLRNYLDNGIRGEHDVRRVSDAPILGGIAFDQSATKRPLVIQASAQSPRAESFRQLRTNLQFAHVSHRTKTVLLTSSVPGEGKSTTAANLAISMAQAGQTVALVDADLRRPMLHEYLGIERNAGLTTALLGQADLSDLVQPWGEDELYVLTSGEIPPNPSELLGSEAMKSLILRLENSFDAVVIDAPPLLPVTDASVLAQHVGGVVLVVGAQRVKQGDLENSLKALRLVGADILGMILNRLPPKGPDAYTYGYYVREDKSTDKRRRHSVNKRNKQPEELATTTWV